MIVLPKMSWLLALSTPCGNTESATVVAYSCCPNMSIIITTIMTTVITMTKTNDNYNSNNSKNNDDDKH